MMLVACAGVREHLEAYHDHELPLALALPPTAGSGAITRVRLFEKSQMTWVNPTPVLEPLP